MASDFTETTVVLLTYELQTVSKRGVVQWPRVGSVVITALDIDQFLSREPGKWGIEIVRYRPSSPWIIRGVTDPAHVTRGSFQ